MSASESSERSLANLPNANCSTDNSRPIFHLRSMRLSSWKLTMSFLTVSGGFAVDSMFHRPSLLKVFFTSTCTDELSPLDASSPNTAAHRSNNCARSMYRLITTPNRRYAPDKTTRYLLPIKTATNSSRHTYTHTQHTHRMLNRQESRR